MRDPRRNCLFCGVNEAEPEPHASYCPIVRDARPQRVDWSAVAVAVVILLTIAAVIVAVVRETL